MSSKVAFLFPGQGSQAVGMGKALAASSKAAAQVFAEADAALGEASSPGAQAGPLSQVIFEGPVDELKRTRTTQPAILTTSIACLRALEERGVHAPAYVAGHSLGELSALVAAGSLSLADAVRAVRARGTFMQEAVPEGQGAMAAVLGLDAGKIGDVVKTVDGAWVANENGPEQTVIAGTQAGVAAATTALKAAGAKRVMPLPVSAPFHCPLMAPVQPRLDDVLAGLTIGAPRVPVVTNVDARPNSDASKVRGLLVQQVTARVRFTEIARFLLDDGVDTFVEVGPGKVLIGILKRMGATRMFNVEDPASLDATVAALGGSNG
ncbi:MAG TPA: ACP S-malonyltransferase [Myxococcota bacterium]